MESMRARSLVVRGAPACGRLPTGRARLPAAARAGGPVVVTARFGGGRGGAAGSGGRGGGSYAGARTELPRAPPAPPPQAWLAPPSKPAPEGTSWYETMLLLRPDASAKERTTELDKIKALLVKEGAESVEVQSRDATKASYAIEGHSSVNYVQMYYTAPPSTVKKLHALFAQPVVGMEKVLLRYMTFKKEADC